MTSPYNSGEVSPETSSSFLGRSLEVFRDFKQKNSIPVDCGKIVAVALIFTIPGYLLADQQGLKEVSPSFLGAVYFTAYVLHVVVQLDEKISFEFRAIPLILLLVAAIIADPRNWFGSSAYAIAMFSLSLLTTLWLRFAARQENTSEPAYPRGPPDAQVFGLDRVSQINIDLMRSGPASHCHSELSGTALTLTSENTTTGSRRAAMEEDGTVIPWRNNFCPTSRDL